MDMVYEVPPIGKLEYVDEPGNRIAQNVSIFQQSRLREMMLPGIFDYWFQSSDCLFRQISIFR
jgi:hypothetical protein